MKILVNFLGAANWSENTSKISPGKKFTKNSFIRNKIKDIENKMEHTKRAKIFKIRLMKREKLYVSLFKVLHLKFGMSR